jgi:hypothetical protein
MRKLCLIYQPLGLGDIIWILPIIDTIINSGYDVYYPVGDVYYDMVSEYIQKDNLFWVRENDNFPLKHHYGKFEVVDNDTELYLPIRYADRYFPNCSTMIAKYYFLSVPIVDWRKSFSLKRNLEREEKLIQTYGLSEDYILVNRSFGTEYQDRNLTIESDKNVHYMNVEQDKLNGFHLFDWVLALERSKEIHTVETSLCFLIDKYCLDNEIHIYEKRKENEENTFYRHINLVFRNPNWIYEN